MHPKRLSFRPVAKLSKILVSIPSPTNFSAKWLPMNPAPPVISAELNSMSPIYSTPIIS